MACEQNPWTPWNDCTDYPFGVTNENINEFDFNDPLGSSWNLVGDNLGDWLSDLTGQNFDVGVNTDQPNNLYVVMGVIGLVWLLK